MGITRTVIGTGEIGESYRNRGSFMSHPRADGVWLSERVDGVEYQLICTIPDRGYGDEYAFPGDASGYELVLTPLGPEFVCCADSKNQWMEDFLDHPAESEFGDSRMSEYLRRIHYTYAYFDGSKTKVGAFSSIGDGSLSW